MLADKRHETEKSLYLKSFIYDRILGLGTESATTSSHFMGDIGAN